MKSTKIASIGFLLVIMVIAACKTKQTVSTVSPSVSPTTATPTAIAGKVTFETLKPLLDKSCATGGCHGDDWGKKNLKSFSTTKAMAVEGEIREHVLERKDMPPQEKLSDSELKLFSDWLSAGMLEK